MTAPDDPLGRRVLPRGEHRTRRLILWSVLAFIVLLIAVPWLATFATDWLWFREVGYQSVFTTSLTWRVVLFAVSGAVAFGMLYGNGRHAIRGAGVPMVITNARTGQPVDLSRFVPRIVLVIAAFVALNMAGAASTRWMTILQWLHAVPAGVTDSLFGRDVSYYLFKLPALSLLVGGAVALTVLALIGVSIIYLLRGRVRVHVQRIGVPDGEPRIHIESDAARHVAVLLALLFVLLALRLWFIRSAALLQSTTGPFVGASYADVHAMLPAIRVSAVAGLVAAALVLAGAFRNAFPRYALYAIAGYMAIGIVGRGVFPALVQRLSVVPNELARETPYLQRHLEATRAAWGLDSVTTRDLAGDAQLSMADIRNNAPTIENVRLWERDLVQQTFGQLQEIRTYYDFVSVADDRYTVDGRYRQVHLSARELNSASLPTRGFINERLTFTHGMGITMAPVNQVTSEGLPVLFVKDLPPVSTTSLKLTRPQIYYGQLTNSYVFVGTKQQEFDYPAGDANIQTTYSGRGGVAIGSVARRMLFAFQLGSLKILLSNDISGPARILYHREITDRAQTALPFLTFDSEPYLIVTDAGELKWMLDAYTESTHFPYAQRVSNGVNYMRNSVKVVIDAYDGTIDAYVTDARDPVIRTYEAVFPSIFKPLSAMPADIRRHIRFPGDLFRVQVTLQATYHMREPATFYHREDQWQIPENGAREERVNPYMRHIILRLPGEKTPEFIYMTPFTPRGKDNLAAWMVARMDGDHYGEMVVYRFPKQSLVYGPTQVANRINQDTDISRELTLWDQRGSQVIRGELLVIPIEESLIYVQPIFLRAEGGTIPELKRVVVAHGNRVVMSETLEGSLAQMFGGNAANVVASAPSPAGQPAGAESAANADLIRQAREHYDRAIAAQRAGNWSDYGREIEALGAVLKQLRR
ncbi:MAG TPA: UPF0182 family protein [Gemmatimonadaceae bacterium]|nr:UPF0182 family protein [Gemmatimonadaceae bacterium]